MATASRNLEARPSPVDEIPDRVWHRSGGPIRGTIIRYYAAALLVGAGFFTPRTSPVFWVLIVLGIGVAVFTPVVVRKILTDIQTRNAEVPSADAPDTLSALEKRKYLLPFAPHAWLSLERARLSARAGNFRAAAKAYEETARVSKETSTPRLFGAWAQAHLCAGQRPEARKLLEKIPEDERSERERVTWVIANLLEGRVHAGDLDELESCESLAGEPRYEAALAYARLRNGTSEELALEGVGEDPLAKDLFKRARKLVRRDAKSKGRKKGRKKDRPAAASEVEESAAAPTDKKDTKDKKDKKDKKPKKEKKQSKAARKRARREARREERAREREVARLEAEAKEREAHERVVNERDRAMKMARARKAAQERLGAAAGTKSASAPTTTKPAPIAPKAAVTPSLAPKPAPKAFVPAKPFVPSPGPKSPVIPAAPKAPVVAPPPVASKPAPPPPSFDDLFAPPSTGSAKAPVVPPPPPVAAPPVPVVPPPVAGNSKVDDDWGDDLFAPPPPKKK